jgi:hypothetical protein
MRGKKLTAAQVDANTRLDGMRPIYHMNQLITLIANDLIDWNDPTVAKARELADLIDERVPVLTTEVTA